MPDCALDVLLDDQAQVAALRSQDQQAALHPGQASEQDPGSALPTKRGAGAACLHAASIHRDRQCLAQARLPLQRSQGQQPGALSGRCCTAVQMVAPP